MQLPRLMLLAVAASIATADSIPIWEMMPRQEKMGQIMYYFVHLVDQTCTFSYVPDCHHVLTLHGLSNLVNMDDFALNRLDPFQSNARDVIWNEVMTGVWELPQAYLPYYMMPQGEELTNEIDPSYPTYPQTSPNFLYPYPSIPNTHNKPIAAVNNPHPYAVKVAPPPGFSPNTQEVEEGGSEIAPEDRFAGWSDSGNILGEEQAMEFERWSDGDVIVGNQAPVEDIYASWSDAEWVVDDQKAPEDRFASWKDSETTAGNHEIPEDRFTSWNENGMAASNQEIPEDHFTSWNENGMTVANEEIPEDHFTSWNENGMTVANEEIPEDHFASWSDSGASNTNIQTVWSDETSAQTTSTTDTDSTNTKKQAETDRYAAWSDSEAGLSGKGVHKVPAGIKPSANFEPVMVESQVVMSRVAPPASIRAEYSTAPEGHERRKRSIGDRPLLSLLRQ